MEILKHRFTNLFVLRINHDIYDVYYIYILLLIMIMIMIVIKHATDGLYF